MNKPQKKRGLIIFQGKLLPPQTYTVQKKKEVVSCTTEQKAGM
jgi:hypothetical protein